jgi:transposase
MTRLILGLYDDWCHLDARIEVVTGEIEELSHIEPKCQRLMSVPGIGPLISTALVAAWLCSQEALKQKARRGACSSALRQISRWEQGAGVSAGGCGGMWSV